MELWSPVPGWEGFYEVSTYGRVKSLQRCSTAGRGVGVYRGTLLKQSRTAAGYPSVSLSRPGGGKQAYVHRLVAAAFLGPCPDGKEVCHGDGNPRNNAIWNLRYDTRLGNAKDRETHGTNVGGSLPGARNPNAKLTEEVVRFLRENQHLPLRELSRLVGVHLSTVANVLNRKTWNHLV